MEKDFIDFTSIEDLSKLKIPPRISLGSSYWYNFNLVPSNGSYPIREIQTTLNDINNKDNITEIQICNSNFNGILDLSGFKNLIKVECTGTPITGIKISSNLLESLGLSNTAVIDFDKIELPKKIELKRLFIEKLIFIHDIDLKALIYKFGAKMKVMSISESSIKCIEGLDVLKSLRHLFMRSMPNLTTIDSIKLPILNASQIVNLDITGNLFCKDIPTEIILDPLEVVRFRNYLWRLDGDKFQDIIVDGNKAKHSIFHEKSKSLPLRILFEFDQLEEELKEKTMLDLGNCALHDESDEIKLLIEINKIKHLSLGTSLRNLDDNNSIQLSTTISKSNNNLGPNTLKKLPILPVGLQTLQLRNVLLDEFSDFDQLLSVTHLDCSNDMITALNQPNNSTTMDNSVPLEKIENKIKKFSFKSENIKSLNLANNSITSFEFEGNNLETLILSNNLLQTLDINSCQSLQQLQLNSNKIGSIESITQLLSTNKNLQVINLENNSINEIKSLNKFENLNTKILFKGNPIVDCPPIVYETGNLLDIIVDLKKGKSVINDQIKRYFKLVILGDPGTGKTMLKNALLDEDETLGEPNLLKLNNNIYLKLFDFDYEAIKYKLYSLFIDESTIVLINWNSDKNYQFWLDEILSLGLNPVNLTILLVQNLGDEEDHEKIEKKKEFIDSSYLRNKKVNEIFQVNTNLSKKAPNNEKYYSVKRIKEYLLSLLIIKKEESNLKTDYYIIRDKILKKQKINNPIDANILRWLHKAGHLYLFDDNITYETDINLVINKFISALSSHNNQDKIYLNELKKNGFRYKDNIPLSLQPINSGEDEILLSLLDQRCKFNIKMPTAFYVKLMNYIQLTILSQPEKYTINKTSQNFLLFCKNIGENESMKKYPILFVGKEGKNESCIDIYLHGDINNSIHWHELTNIIREWSPNKMFNLLFSFNNKSLESIPIDINLFLNDLSYLIGEEGCYYTEKQIMSDQTLHKTYSKYLIISGVISNVPKVFISYAHEDIHWVNIIMSTLKPYERNNKCKFWMDSDIKTGDDWDKKIKSEFETAQIIILVLSVHFFNSNYIWHYEYKNTLELINKSKVQIFPIYAGKVDLNNVQIDKLSVTQLQICPKIKTELLSLDSLENNLSEGLKVISEEFNKSLETLSKI